jgi:hypothetical protein
MTARRIRDAALALAAALLLIPPASCKSPQPRGQLVVSLQTDLAIPDQIDVIRLQVLINGMREHDEDYLVGHSDQEDRIPATLTLLAGKDPSDPVTIRVAGGKRTGVWRTFREVITTVPADRTALLRMPIQWLCDGTAQVAPDPDPLGNRLVVSSTCGDGNSCVAGECVPSLMSQTNLPNYKPEQVFGGASQPANGTCFDTVACMIVGTTVEPAPADCTIPIPPKGVGLNVALRVSDDGICDSTGTICFVPLDGNTPEGWTVTAAGDRLVLPPAVCNKLTQGAVSEVYVSTACPTKTAAIPPCGTWSSVQGAMVRPAVADGGAPAPPTATKLLSLSAQNFGVPCCPLMQDGPLLYTCLCTTKASTQLVSVDEVTQEVKPVTSIAAPTERTNPYFAATMLDGTLFWVDAVANVVYRNSLGVDAASLAPLPMPGDVTEATPLLVDGASIYLQASAVSGVVGSPMQLVAIDRTSGTIRTFDTGANFHVHEIAQDASSVYVVSDLDTVLDASTLVQRRSSVISIDKSTGAVANVSAAINIATPDQLHGGFLGVHTDLSGVAGILSIDEDAPSADGQTVLTRVVRLAAGGPSTTLLERNLEPASTTLWLMGAIDGAVLLARTENQAASTVAPTILHSSVIVLPAGGGAPWIAADFTGDHPLLGLNALAYDQSSVYWLNSSGDLYRLPRKVLR